MLSTTTAPPGRLRLCVRATRPLYLPTSLLPGLAGLLLAVGSAHADWWLAPVALLALLLVHAATDVCNEVEDAAHGVDTPDTIEHSGVFTSGLMSLREGRCLYAALFAGAFALGLFISITQTPALMIVGVIGLLGGWLYTGGPRPYKYDGLGDPLIVLLMGPLLTQGAYTAVTGDAFSAPAFWLGMAPGLLIAAVLAGNNLSDIDGDRRAGVRTVAVKVGFTWARRLYLVALAGALAAPIALWGSGLMRPWVLLPLLLLPLGVARARQALAAPGSEDQALATLAPFTAQLHMAFCLLLCLGVVLDRV